MVNFSDTSRLNFYLAEADYGSPGSQVRQSIIKVGRRYHYREVEVKDETNNNL